MVVSDRPSCGSTKQGRERRAARSAASETIDGVDHSSKGGAQVLGIFAGDGARKHNGD
ncbi:MAG: hypothetical protein ACLPSW_16295 [Roseiarcus sp.]